MWSRWKAGQSLHEIGRAFGKDHVSSNDFLGAQFATVQLHIRASVRAKRGTLERDSCKHPPGRRIAKDLCPHHIIRIRRRCPALWPRCG